MALELLRFITLLKSLLLDVSNCLFSKNSLGPSLAKNSPDYPYFHGKCKPRQREIDDEVVKERISGISFAASYCAFLSIDMVLVYIATSSFALQLLLLVCRSCQKKESRVWGILSSAASRLKNDRAYQDITSDARVVWMYESDEDGIFFAFPFLVLLLNSTRKGTSIIQIPLSPSWFKMGTFLFTIQQIFHFAK